VYALLDAELRRCPCGTQLPYAKAKVCAACSRRSSATFYERHSARVLARYHSQKNLKTEVDKKIRRARAYLATYVKRGAVRKGPCDDRTCRALEVSPIQPDLDHPLVVVWACKDHKARIAAELDADIRYVPAPPAQPRRERRVLAQRQSWASEHDRVLAAIEQLAPDEAAALRAAAATVNGIRISPESPLYRMNLVNVYKRRFSEVQRPGQPAAPS
jgi:hypothetical protein